MNVWSKTKSSGGRGPGRTMTPVITACLAVLAAASMSAPAAAQVRIVDYNIAQLNGDLNALTGVLAEIHADASRGFAVPVTIFLFQEVEQADVNDLSVLVNNAAPPGVFYQLATYTNFNEDNFGGAQACFYDQNTVDHVAMEHDDIYTGAGRDADRWKFTLDGYTDPVVSFYVYSAHLKADTNPDDEQQRVDGVSALRANAGALPAGSHVIFAGDFNIYSNSEPAYALLLASGPARMYDPLGSGSWGGSSNAFKHTQSPRASGGGGLIGGGLDDRFDYQLINIEFNDGDGLARIIGDYRAFGNDGQHYNSSINSGNNFYFPGDVPRSNALADDLFSASDHVPVVADYQVPAVMLATMNTNFGRVIQNTPFTVDASVSNFAQVVAPEGADALDYQITGTGVVLGSASGSVQALNGPAVELLDVDTSTVGTVNGGIVATTASEGAQVLSGAGSTTGHILRPANPSFSDASDLDDATVTINVEANTGMQPIAVDVFNFGFDADQALLDIDSVSGAAAPFSFDGGLATGIGAAHATLQFSFDTTGLADGNYQESIGVLTSDEDIPGEAVTPMTLTLSVTVGSTSSCPADIDGSSDGIVDVFDLFVLLNNWGGSGAGADLAAPDDVVDVFDLFELLGAWGACP